MDIAHWCCSSSGLLSTWFAFIGVYYLKRSYTTSLNKTCAYAFEPVNAMDAFLHLCANLQNLVAQTKTQLVLKSTTQKAFETLFELAKLLPKICLSQSPIDILKMMSMHAQYAHCPLLFSYNNHSHPLLS